jgi:ParB-like chromosome segregation protein Spo0J
MGTKRSPAAEPGAPQIVLRPLASLVHYARNARTHSTEQLAQLQASIVEYGFTNPILADARGIVAGHGRSMAASALHEAGIAMRFPDGAPIPAGMVPVIDCAGWSEAQRQAYILADNKLALNAGWDTEMLRVELDDLQVQGFDLGLTGFSTEEIDLTINGWSSDIDSLKDRDGEHTEGLSATVKVTVNPDMKDRATEVVHSALRAAGIQFE